MMCICSICMRQPTHSILRYEFSWTHREVLHSQVDRHMYTSCVHTHQSRRNDFLGEGYPRPCVCAVCFRMMCICSMCMRQPTHSIKRYEFNWTNRHRCTTVCTTSCVHRVYICCLWAGYPCVCSLCFTMCTFRVPSIQSCSM